MSGGLLQEPDTKFFSNAVNLSMVISQLYKEDAKKIRRTMFEYMPEIIDMINDDDEIIEYIEEPPNACAQLTYRLFSIELSLKPEFVETYISGDLELENIVYKKIDENFSEYNTDDYFKVTIGINFE